MNQLAQFRKIRCYLVAIVAVLGSFLSVQTASADKPQKGKSYHGGYGNNGCNRGSSFLDISPYGVSFGYQDRNFGLQIGPIGGGYYQTAPTIVYPQPTVIQPALVQPAIVSQGSAAPVYQNPLVPGVPVEPAAEFATLIPANRKAAIFQQQAERAFVGHQYEDAASLVKHALMEDNQNGRLYLFAAQAEFAIGDYRSAVAAIESATELLPASEWGFVVANYRRLYDSDHYVRQTDRLVQYLAQNPGDSDSRTLCGYHYGYLGYTEAARDLFKQALRIDPHDRLAAKFLTAFSENSPAPFSQNVPAPLPSDE